MTARSDHDYGPTLGTGPTARPARPHPDSPAGRALDRTAAGFQTVLTGAERASEATMAQRAANAPLKPKTAQKPCDVGLFGDEANQEELF